MRPPLKHELANLWLDIREAPRFLFTYALGLLALPIRQIDFTSLLVCAILVGVATSAVIGGAVYFGGYVLMRQFDSLAGGLHHIGYRNG